MKQRELEELMHEIASEIRGEGAILDLANNHRVTYVDLWFVDDAGHTTYGELFHAGRHGDDKEGKYPNATAEEAAEAVVKLLEASRDWPSFARQHNLHDIYVTVQKGVDKVRKYLHHAVKGGGGIIPEDPLIVF